MAILRSVLAVVAGFLFVVVASTGMDFVLEHTVLPGLANAQASPPLLALALAYRVAFGVAGAWITARLAPSRPMTHAIVLGVIGTLAGTAGVVAGWSMGQHWYPIALAAMGAPQSWLGARLAERRGASQAA